MTYDMHQDDVKILTQVATHMAYKITVNHAHWLGEGEEEYSASCLVLDILGRYELSHFIEASLDSGEVLLDGCAIDMAVNRHFGALYL